jgi:hypothetical protein
MVRIASRRSRASTGRLMLRRRPEPAGQSGSEQPGAVVVGDGTPQERILAAVQEGLGRNAEERRTKSAVLTVS